MNLVHVLFKEDVKTWWYENLNTNHSYVYSKCISIDRRYSHQLQNTNHLTAPSTVECLAYMSIITPTTTTRIIEVISKWVFSYWFCIMSKGSGIMTRPNRVPNIFSTPSMNTRRATKCPLVHLPPSISCNIWCLFTTL